MVTPMMAGIAQTQPANSPRDNNLYALNHDGSERWSFTMAGKSSPLSAVCVGGTIYIGSFGAKL